MKLPTWISHEPVAWIALADALMLLIVTFGLDRLVGIHLDNDKKIAIDGFLQVVAGLLTRAAVTPNAKAAATAQNVVVSVPPAAPPPPAPQLIPPTGGGPSGTP